MGSTDSGCTYHACYIGWVHEQSVLGVVLIDMANKNVVLMTLVDLSK